MSKNNYFSSSVGKKQLMGITGLALCGFLFAHVSGNFLLFVGAKEYNMYSHALISNPFLVLAELGLVLFILIHMVQAFVLTRMNKEARPVKYAIKAKGEKATSLVSTYMWQQGVIILVFIALHLWTFKYGEVIYAEYDGVQVRDLFGLVVQVFQSPIYLAGYLLALLVLGLHLSHGFQSTFKTMGFNHPKYEPKLKLMGHSFAAYVALGFMVQPVYIYLFH